MFNCQEKTNENSKHVAIKCTYNNGGEGVYVGFSDTCSEDIIKWNIEQGRVWCSNEDCDCWEYYNNGFKGERPVEPCWESVIFRKKRIRKGIFREGTFGAGGYLTGKRAGKPIHYYNVKEGKVAILTTRFPEDKEVDRKIIGFFKIATVINRKEDETIIKADEKFLIRLPLEEAKELYFWDYYTTKGGAKWNTGLFRYLDDNQVYWILKDVKDTIRDEKNKKLIEELLKQEFPDSNYPPPIGARKDKKEESRIKRILKKRKYGPGGEGEDHKRLKEYIFKHPEKIGLTNVKNKEYEYVFPSQDMCDILFELDGNKYAVVEIETTDALTGFYQVLKYRILKCAEEGLEITSQNVKAILVAWKIDENIRSLCKKYGVCWIEKKI